MKKIMTTLTVALLCATASYAVDLVDKTSSDQIGFRVLQSGQMTWNEEDGGAVLYLGSASEVKNLRVIDPTSLRGYRNKIITDELSISVPNMMSMQQAGSYKYQHNSSYPITVEYEQASTKTNVVHSGSLDLTLYTLSNGDYTPHTYTEGDVIPYGTTTLYRRYRYVDVEVKVFSKYSNITSIDYQYTEATGSFGDFNPMVTSREVSYDGRTATILIRVHVDELSSNGWFTLSNFSARCLGNGDVDEYINDVTEDSDNGLTVKIQDKLGVYNLNELRHSLIHKYDGNRGEDWARYVAKDTVKLGKQFMLFGGSEYNLPRYVQGFNIDRYTYACSGVNFMDYIPATDSDLVGTVWEGCQIQITDITQVGGSGSGHPWKISFSVNRTVPIDMLEVVYCADLKSQMWMPVNGIITDVSGSGTDFEVEIPLAYSVERAGFYKVFPKINKIKSHLDINCSIRVMGQDGKMYKLTWPTGGGTVTATLDE